MAVVIQHQRPMFVHPVGIGKDIFINMVTGKKIIQHKVLRPGKEPAAAQQRENPHFMATYQAGIDLLVPIGAFILHAVFFVESFDLPMAEHW